jgi:hypothetical protein
MRLNPEDRARLDRIAEAAESVTKARAEDVRVARDEERIARAEAAQMAEEVRRLRAVVQEQRAALAELRGERDALVAERTLGGSLFSMLQEILDRMKAPPVKAPAKSNGTTRKRATRARSTR